MKKVKSIFWECLKHGFYFRDTNNDIYYIEPNAFDIHYFNDRDNLQIGFRFQLGKGVHWVYLQDSNYGFWWSIDKEDLL